MSTIPLTDKPVNAVRTLLKYTYGLVPVVAGADKFINLLTNWPGYLQPVENILPVSAPVFMKIAGIIEIMAGLLVLRFPRTGALVVCGWLIAIAVILIIGGSYDIAVRDIVMATGAFSLSRLYEKEKVSA